MNQSPSDLSDRGSARRQFLQTSGLAAGLAALSGTALSASTTNTRDVTPASTAPRDRPAETTVRELFASLDSNQRTQICFASDDATQRTIDPNWNVTKPTLADSFYTDSQRDLADRIIRQLTSDDGYQRFQKQMEEDSGGLGAYSMALYGNPEEGPFQWMLTGRHLTLRCDGNSINGFAFGGGLVYGHGEESRADANLFYHQTQAVNAFLDALEEPLANRARCDAAPDETSLDWPDPSQRRTGLLCSELASDQKTLLEQTLRKLLDPYRHEDADEAMQHIQSQGGIDSLSIAFYQRDDLEGDRIWDMWRIEGPSMVWHFRGAPHVHAYIHIGARPTS
jgi:hypothetical protein